MDRRLVRRRGSPPSEGDLRRDQNAAIGALRRQLTIEDPTAVIGQGETIRSRRADMDIPQGEEGTSSRWDAENRYLASDSGIIEGRATPGSQELQIYDLVQVAHHFRVSTAAALFRLKNLGLLKAPQFDRLKSAIEEKRDQQVARHLGLPRIAHKAARNELRLRFLSLALEAYRRGVITRTRLAELATMVALPERELEDLLLDAGVEQQGGVGVELPS